MSNRTSQPRQPPLDLPEALCRHCAICCNGMLFRDVELESELAAKRLNRMGLKLGRRGHKKVLPQPCGALEGKDCRCYSTRPRHCRRFECALYRNVASGSVPLAVALRIVGKTLRQGQSISKLLLQLGEDDLASPLRLRFARLARHLTQIAVPPREADRYAELTVRMHALQLLLSKSFYPDNRSRGG